MKTTLPTAQNNLSRTIIIIVIFLVTAAAAYAQQAGNRDGEELLPADRTQIQDTMPCIYVGDLPFGTLTPGESKMLPLTICNEGGGEITFHDPFLTSLVSAFSVPSSDIDQLKAVTLRQGNCITIHVTFESDTTGLFLNVARFWANTRSCRDTSVWSANVIKPDPFISGHDWGKVRISALNLCTKSMDWEYHSAIYAINKGSADFTVAKIELLGDDATDRYFRLDSSNNDSAIAVGDRIRRGDTSLYRLFQRVIFTPTEERLYQCTVRLITTNGDTAWNILQGTGIESHIAVGSHDFGAVEYIGPHNPLILGSVAISAPQSMRNVTITDIEIDDPNFRLTGLARTGGATIPLTTPFTPFSMTNNEQVIADIEFDPQSAEPANKMGRIILIGDFSNCDDSTGMLSATLATSGVSRGTAAPTVDRIEPNPFTSSTKISFRTERRGHTTVEIYDQAGKLIESLADGDFDSGDHVLLWSPADLPPGVYYCRIRSGERESTQSVLLVR